MSCQHMLCMFTVNSLIVIEMKIEINELYRRKKSNAFALLMQHYCYIIVIFCLGTEEKLKQMLQTAMDNFTILLKNKEGKESN